MTERRLIEEYLPVRAVSYEEYQPYVEIKGYKFVYNLQPVSSKKPEHK